MALSAFGYAVLIVVVCAPLAALWAVFRALRVRRLFWEDLGTLVTPPILFVAVGLTRADLQVGWAMVLWPIIIAVLAMYAYSVKATAVDSWAPSARRNSVALATVCSGAAILAALTVPPWYE